MAEITLKGNKIHTSGKLPEIGVDAPDFILTKTDLKDVSLKNFENKRIVLNVFPSIDTPVCATSVRRFNSDISKINNAVALCISLDLPFAHSRFCETEGLKDVIPLSELRNRNFGEAYGLRIIDGPLEGLLSRAVIIIDENKKVIYMEQVPEIGQEPDYDSALSMLQSNNFCEDTTTAEHARFGNADDACDDGR